MISLAMDLSSIYFDNNLAITVIFNKGFITTIYSAICTYIFYVLINEIARLVRETREKKLTEISRAKVKARQIAEWMRKKHKPCVAFTGKRRFSLSY